MNAAQFEARVLDRIAHALAGHTVEDSTFELKAQWPVPRQAARDVAAMCNAAHGSPVALIVGVDEKQRKVVDVLPREKSTWVPQFDACFDAHVAPSVLFDQVVPVGDSQINALLFDSERVPYVIRPIGDDRTDVPYRVAGRVVSARREQLLRILARTAKLPEIEVISAVLHEANINNHTLEIGLYVMPSDANPVGLSAHRTKADLYRARTTGEANEQRRVNADLHNPRFTVEGESSKSAVAVQGPLRVDMKATLGFPGGHLRADPSIVMKLSMRMVGTDAPVVVAFVLVRVNESMYCLQP